MAKLILINPGMDKMEFPLGRAMLLIGRDSEADLQLNSGDVAKNHASIIYRDEQYFVRDNGSENGTMVNGVKVTEQMLSNGDVVHFGPYLFQVDLLSDDESVQNLVNTKTTHIQRHGHDYRESVTIEPVKGAEKSGPVKIVMANRKGSSIKKSSSIPIEPPTRGVPIWLFSMLMALLFFAGYQFYNHITDRNRNEKVQLQAQIQSLKKSQESHDEVVKKFQRDILELEGKFNKLQDLNTVLKIENTSLKQETESGRIKRLLDQVKKGEEDFAAYKLIHPPASSLIGTPQTEPPFEVALKYEVQAPSEAGGKSTGVVKIPAGQNLKVLVRDGNYVWLEYSKMAVRVKKDDTNIKELLAQIQEREVLEKINAKDKIINKDFIKEAFKNDLVKLQIPSVDKIASPKELSGNDARGVPSWVVDVDTTNVFIGDTWTADVYPIGVKTSPDDASVRYRLYTADFEKYVAFKKNPNNANSVLGDSKTVGIADLIFVYNQLNIAEITEEFNKIFKKKDVTERTRELELKRYAASILPNLAQATEASKALIRDCSNKSYQAWLEDVVLSHELLKRERFDPFLKKLAEIELNYINLKVKAQQDQDAKGE